MSQHFARSENNVSYLPVTNDSLNTNARNLDWERLLLLTAMKTSAIFTVVCMPLCIATSADQVFTHDGRTLVGEVSFGPNGDVMVAGQTLNANETPIHIVDNTRMWLMIDAAEQALSYLEEGQSVRFDVRPFPDARFTGQVDWISPRLDAQTRTVQVRAIVDNPDGLLRAGMFATATIAAGQGHAPDSIASGSRHTQVPIDAVQQIGARQGVFVPGEGEGVFVFTPVTTGRESSGQVEISSGVSVGPGATQLTVIWRLASSMANALVAPMTPALAAL